MIAPAGRERAGAATVLSVYAATLLLVPSRYTIGSAALSVSMLVAVVAGLVWTAGLVAGRPTALLGEAAGRGAVAFAVVAVVAYTTTMLRPGVAASVSAADRRMVATLCALAVAALALDGVRSRRALDQVLGTVVVAGGALAAVGILQYGLGWDLAPNLRVPGFGATGPVGFIFDRQGRTRVAGTTRHPIEFGIVCAAILPLALHRAMHASRRRGRQVATVASVLLALGVPLALSRVAVAAAAAGLIVLLWCLPSGRRRGLLAAAAVGVLLFVVIVPGSATTVRDLFTTDLAEASNTARAGAVDEALDRFWEAPLIGQGLGATQDVIVDNQYVLSLAEGGMLGALALLLMLSGVVASARGTRRDAPDPTDRELGGAFLAALTALAVAGAGFATLGAGASIGLTFLLVGLAGAHHGIVLAEAPGRDRPAPARRGTSHPTLAGRRGDG